MNFIFLLLINIGIVSFTSGAPSTTNNNVRIIGGEDATTTTYQVSIQTGLLNIYFHQCGGALITPKWVITAAHCITINLLLSRVVAGTSNLSAITDEDQAQIRKIDFFNIVTHPNYTNAPPLNDIAVFKVTEPFRLSETIQPIPIAKVTCISDDSAMFSGWGINKIDGSNGEIATVLQTANLTIIDHKYCVDLLNPLFGNNLILVEQANFCTADEVGPCLLDDGGPIVQNDRLIGLLSLLPTVCSTKTVPSIFVDVGYHASFIEAHVDDLPLELLARTF